MTERIVYSTREKLCWWLPEALTADWNTFRRSGFDALEAAHRLKLERAPWAARLAPQYRLAPQRTRTRPIKEATVGREPKPKKRHLTPPEERL